MGRIRWREPKESVFHNDEPSLLDALDRGVLIEEVGEAIATCTPPQVFGIHGDWGLGKTSFLHQVQWYLTGDCPQQPATVTEELRKGKRPEAEASTPGYGIHRKTVHTVWFDAWRYQNDAAPVVALLHEMRAQLSWTSRVAGSTARKTRVAVRGALLSMEELTKKIGFQYSKFQQANREWETENLATALPSHTLREHLHAAVAQLLSKRSSGNATPRLVVFIDDVDRCEPDAAYRLLEGLKIYLTLDNCVFVLGMNQKAIIDAISRRWTGENQDNPSLRAAAYMEKLCQNVWRLPAVRQPVQVLYRLLEKTVANTNIRDCIRNGLQQPQHPCLPPNPRRLKGFANLLGRLSPRIEEVENPEELMFETQLLAIVAYVYQFHHDLYVRWESNLDLYDRMRDWCEGNPQEHAVFDHLELPLQQPQAEVGKSTAPTADDFESTYPDPTEANVFWIQSLILHLGSEVTRDKFERYLHGIPA